MANNLWTSPNPVLLARVSCYSALASLKVSVEVGGGRRLGLVQGSFTSLTAVRSRSSSEFRGPSLLDGGEVPLQLREGESVVRGVLMAARSCSGSEFRGPSLLLDGGEVPLKLGEAGPLLCAVAPTSLYHAEHVVWATLGAGHPVA